MVKGLYRAAEKNVSGQLISGSCDKMSGQWDSVRRRTLVDNKCLRYICNESRDFPCR